MNSNDVCRLLIADCKRDVSGNGYGSYDRPDYIDEPEFDSNPSDCEDDLDDIERADLKRLQDFNRELDELKKEYPWYNFSRVRPGDNLGIVECDARLFQDYLFYD